MGKPIMEHLLNLLVSHGIRDVLVTLQYKPEIIEDYFGSGSQFGIHIRYFVEGEPLGTAGSVKSAEGFLNDTFLVISGDAMTDMDLTAAVEYHHCRGSLATIVLTRVPTPLEYGVVILDEGGRVQRFLEKPSWGEVFSDMVNTGVYVLEPAVLGYFESGKQFDFSKDLFPMLLQAGEPMYGYETDGYWCDVGNLEAYRQTHFDILSGKARFCISSREVGPGVWIEDGTEVHRTATIQGPAYIGARCKIGPNAEIGEYSVLGEQVLVGTNASLKRSVLWNNVYLGSEVELRGAILCDRVSVKDRCAVFEGAVVGTDSTVGQKSIVKPGVKVWPDKIVSPGTTLSSSVIWGSTSFNRLFGTLGIAGGFNIEMTAEFAAKLGAAYGSGLTEGTAVVLGADGSKGAQVIKRALSAGVLSSGHDVRDIGTVTMPVARFAVARLRSGGGIYVARPVGDPNGVLARFIDDKALDIDGSEQRRIERDFFGEDFARAHVHAVGELSHVADIAVHYLNALESTLDVPAIRDRKFRVVLEADRLTMLPLVRRLAERFGLDMIAVDDPIGHAVDNTELTSGPNGIETEADRVLEGLVGVSQRVLSSGADLGVVIDPGGERVILVDERGSSLSGDSFLALLSLMVLRQRTGARVVAPVTAPAAIERLAHEFDGEVVRTKANLRSIMETMMREKVFIGGSDLPSFQPAFDAVAALARILEFMAKEKVPLSQLMTRVPPIHMDKATVSCPWERKGEVMRTLIETEAKDRLELLDGIKVYHDSGWALVLPDSDEPVVHVYSEAASMEDAMQLREMYVSRITEISGQRSPESGRSGDHS